MGGRLASKLPPFLPPSHHTTTTAGRDPSAEQNADRTLTITENGLELNENEQKTLFRVFGSFWVYYTVAPSTEGGRVCINRKL